MEGYCTKCIHIWFIGAAVHILSVPPNVTRHLDKAADLNLLHEHHHLDSLKPTNTLSNTSRRLSPSCLAWRKRSSISRQVFPARLFPLLDTVTRGLLHGASPPSPSILMPYLIRIVHGEATEPPSSESQQGRED